MSRPADVAPTGNLDQAIVVTEEIRTLLGAMNGLVARVEEVTAMRASQLQLLARVAENPGTVDDLARHARRPAEITRRRLDDLAIRGLVTVSEDAGRDLVAVTDLGSAALAQVQALQIRVLDRVIADLGPDGTTDFQRILRQLPAALAAAHTA